MKSFRFLFLLGAVEFAFLVVFVLKLAGVPLVASWAWRWILSPIWIPILAVLLFGFCVLLWVVAVALFRISKSGWNALRN